MLLSMQEHPTTCRFTRCALLAVGAALLWFTCTGVTAAADCTTQQRADGNRWLWLNQRDADLSIQRNAPWGEPRQGDTGTGRLLVQSEYVIGYDDERRVPSWVAYRLNGVGLNHVNGRIECFREDDRLPERARSRPSDYEKSGFDQGHLAPSEDMSRTIRQNVNSFIMSNMAPQYGSFNRVIWRRLEGYGQKWAKLFGTVYVVSGTIFDADGDGSPDDAGAAKRVKKRVGIPTHFFKVIARECEDGRLESLTVILPHENGSRAGDAAVKFLGQHIVTLAKVEALSGVRAFATLEADKRIERTTLWPVAAGRGGSAPAPTCGE
jgi:DNA/RNA endonuclease G (NUC1)